MKRLAESWGDQPYGAVVVLAGELLGESPSRVVKNRDPQAHAEHEAIRDAQRRLGRIASVRRCPVLNVLGRAVCAKLSLPKQVYARMFFGPSLTDAWTATRSARMTAPNPAFERTRRFAASYSERRWRRAAQLER